jgi:anaerobic ribonucleoside-triphosphate reductase activating protein
MTSIYKDIKLTYPDDMPLQEAERYCQDEIDAWVSECPDKAIASVEIVLHDGEVEIHSLERSPIKRVRRVSGYLSTLDHFGDSKLAEERDRVKHC